MLHRRYLNIHPSGLMSECDLAGHECARASRKSELFWQNEMCWRNDGIEASLHEWTCGDAGARTAGWHQSECRELGEK